MRPTSRYPWWLRLTPLIPLVLGAWLSVTYADAAHAGGESGKAALSLLHLGYIGNPYLLPSGPTAHVSPISTGLIAGVFWLFGADTTNARIVLGLLCAVSYSVGAWLALRICEELKVPVAAALPAVVLTSLVPFFLYDVVVVWRYWDQPYGATLLCAGLLVLLKGLNGRYPAYATVAVLAVIAGLGDLISPTASLPIVVGIGIFIYDVRHRIAVIPAALLGIGIIAVCVAPWAIRNDMVLGKPIIARSNFGLELAVGNQDGISADYQVNEGLPIHPNISEPAARRLVEVGEVRYMADMQQLGVAWIMGHPLGALRLTAGRAVVSFFPARDMVEWVPVLHNSVWYIFLAYGALTLAVLVRVLVAGGMRVVWLTFVLLPIAPYIVTHTQPRYTYVAFFTSVSLIAVGLLGKSGVKRLGRGDYEAAPSTT